MSTEKSEEGRSWRLLAIEAREIAVLMKNPGSKATMLMIAAGYEQLADQANERARTKPSIEDMPPPKG